MRIVFMGTPEFAVAILDAIVKSEHEVVAVVTAPDKPAGRGQKVKPSAVKKYAEECELPVLQPTNLKSPEFLDDLKTLKADAFVVVSFRMLPRVVWEIPNYGTINLHASLLPQYRGAAPINWVIINGEEKTGLTTFLINHKIDEGQILLQEEMEILPDDNAGSLHDRMKDQGGALIVKTLDGVDEGSVKPHPQRQKNGKLQPAPKLYKEDRKLDFEQPARKVLNRIRGLAPYPAAFVNLISEDHKHSTSLKIFDARLVPFSVKVPPGRVLAEHKRLYIAAEDAWLEILDAQLPGKKRLPIADLLNGFREIGDYKAYH